MMAKARAGRWGALAVEACGSLLLVLALFWLFIMFLYAMFPSGTPLKEMIESRLEPPGRSASVPLPEATLSSLLRDVRFRRGNSIAWSGASRGMQLYSQDAVQTFDNSGAGISFGAKDRISVGSNSMIVVTRLNQSDEAGPRSYRVQVDGEMRGTLSGAKKLRLEFAAAGHLARMAPGASRFRVTQNGAKGSSLAVYAGEARVLDHGRMVRVPANFGVTLQKGAPVGPAVPLPAAPLPGGPEKALYRYRQLPPRVRFSWSGAAGDYHFQLSRDARFASCLIDQRLGSPEFATGKLAKGSYFWRVSRVEEGREGLFSRVGRCELLQQLTPPQLQVSFPPEKAQAGLFTLKAATGPEARLFVDGVEVKSETPGSFELGLRLKPGVNLIRVEALDPAGNVSYASRIVYAGAEAKPPGAAAK
jgi:hypothetical protein